MMFSLFGGILQSPAERARVKQMRDDAIARRVAIAVPWDSQMKWEPELNIKADTYKVLSLFDVNPTDTIEPNRMQPDEYVSSPNGDWRYCHKRLPRGKVLLTFSGSKRGTVMFDGPVIIPCLHQHLGDNRWDDNPFMSLTPMEMLSLRTGTKMARGSVIVAGLGLGHQLIEVSKRKQVKKLVLVERSQDLVDWLYPRIKPHLGMDVEIVVGDAYEAMPKMKADIALIDIFPNYGNNSFCCDKFYRLCPQIKKIWCWGTAAIGDER